MMFKCRSEFRSNEKFCRRRVMLTGREQGSMFRSSTDRRFTIKHYFERGFHCKTIVHSLGEYHGISINVRTLKRRIRPH